MAYSIEITFNSFVQSLSHHIDNKYLDPVMEQEQYEKIGTLVQNAEKLGIKVHFSNFDATIPDAQVPREIKMTIAQGVASFREANSDFLTNNGYPDDNRGLANALREHPELRIEMENHVMDHMRTTNPAQADEYFRIKSEEQNQNNQLTADYVTGISGDNNYALVTDARNNDFENDLDDMLGDNATRIRLFSDLEQREAYENSAKFHGPDQQNMDFLITERESIGPEQNIEEASRYIQQRNSLDLN
jgi:hypothetical protein